MTVALFAALSAAVCSGSAAVLQAKAVGRTTPERGSQLNLVPQLARSGWYVVGLGLVALGALLSLVALRDLPVFVVAAVRASSLGVTALLAWLMLGLSPRRKEVWALSAVAIGLVLLVAGASSGPSAEIGAGKAIVLLVALVSVTGLATLLGRSASSRAGAAFATLAGLDFAIVAVGARGLASQAPEGLLLNPAIVIVLGVGLHGLFLYARALQRLAVTHVTAVMVGVETVVGAGAGVLLLADTVRPGWAAGAVAGFVLAVSGCVVLAESRTSSQTAARRGERAAWT